MPQPVKLSDSLIEAAREAAPAAHRSLAAQVEHWATLGRAIEGSLTSDESAILKGHVVRELAAADPAHILAAALERAVSPEFAVQVRTQGRMVKRKFVPAGRGTVGHDALFLLRGEQVTKAKVNWPDVPLSAAAAKRKKRNARSTKSATA